MSKQTIPTAASFIVIFLFLCFGIPAHGQTYEDPANFQASKIIPLALQRGAKFKVNDRVTSDGYLYIFQVQSEYGDYQAHGIVALKKLIYEINVLAELDKFTRSKVFIDAAEKGGISIITAPVKVVQNVANAVINPSDTVETIKKVPEGVASIFTWASDKVQSGAQYVAQSVSENSNNSENTGEIKDKSVDAASKAGLDYIGYNDREGEWYQKYELDPYTTNKALRDRISQIAQVETAVNIGFKFVPGIGGLGVLNDANRYINLTKKVSVYADPAALYNKNKLALQDIGFPEDKIDQFFKNKNYSPTLNTILVDGILKLKGVENVGSLLDIANNAKTPQGAVFYTQAICYLGDKQEKNKAIKSIFKDTNRIPIALTTQGVTIPFPVDHASWTKELDQGFLQLIAKLKSTYKNVKISIILDGNASPMFKKRTESQGASIVTNEIFGSPYKF